VAAISSSPDFFHLGPDYLIFALLFCWLLLGCDFFLNETAWVIWCGQIQSGYFMRPSFLLVYGVVTGNLLVK
jgi:hypothetical protein